MTEKEIEMPQVAAMNEDDLVHVPDHQIQIVNVPADQTVEIVICAKKKNIVQVEEIHVQEMFREENVHRHVKLLVHDVSVAEAENVQSCK